MAKITKALLFIFSLTFFCSSGPAYAGKALFGNVGLDPSFCNQKTVRQTVVYIDDMMMIDGKVEWAKKINSKLKSSLAPGERVTVVKLSPETGQSAEVWIGCWPAYTQEQKDNIQKQTYFFSQNPLEGISEQQAFFVRDFGSALTAIYEQGKRPESDVRINPSTPPKKSILRALSSDDGRFSNSGNSIRAIIYSDMLENSELGSVYSAIESPFPNYADKLGSRFKKGIFYAFGVGETLDEGKSPPDNIKSYWAETFKNMSSVLGGLGSDLNISNSIPVQSYNYNMDYQFDGQDLDGKMSLLVDSDGNLIDSWVGFSRLSISGVDGTFLCSDSSCKLEGTTTSSIATNSPSESLIMSGRIERLNGQLGVMGTKMIFPLQGQLVKN